MKVSYLLAFCLAGASAAMADEPVLTFDAAVARALELAPQMEAQRAALKGNPVTRLAVTT